MKVMRTGRCRETGKQEDIMRNPSFRKGTERVLRNGVAGVQGGEISRVTMVIMESMS